MRNGHSLNRTAAVGCVLIFICTSAVAAYLHYSRTSHPRATASLLIHPASLELGPIWLEKSRRWDIPVQNASNDPITVANLKASCSCLSFTPSQTVISPGETVPFHAELDLSRAKFRDPAKADFAIRFIAVIPDRQFDVPSWIVRGSIRQQCEASPAKLVFPSGSIISGVAPSPRTIQITSHIQEGTLSASCDPHFASLALEADTNDKDRYSVAVTPRHDLSPGEHTFDVLISITAPSETHLPEFSVPVVLNVSSGVQVDPAEINWGAVSLGEQLIEQLAINSIAGEDLRVLDVKSESPSLEIMPGTNPGSYMVRTKAAILADFKSNIVFRITKGQSREPLLITVPVTYLGVAP